MDDPDTPPGKDAASEPTKDPTPLRRGALRSEQVGRALGAWQASELRLARSFPECRNLGHAQLEDLYQETALVLLSRPYHDEEHLRNALRWGIKHRALHLHRDTRRRGEILEQRGPELQLAAERREGERTPELAALLAQDRLVVSEFLAELTELERRVFWLIAEGMRYRAIAPILQIPVNEARKASRACESKRERFQLLYDTGRMCGYRGHTIRALKAGESTTVELAQRAFAHLEACANCRAEHKTNALRLRRRFQGEVAALLPIPAIATHLGWLGKLGQRTRDVHARLLPYGSPPATGGVRERTIAMLASGGAAAKVAAGAATVALLAGSTLGATQALHPGPSPHRHRAKRAATHRVVALAQPVAVVPSPASTESSPREAGTPTSSRRQGATRHERQPGGFAFLGVPSSGSSAEKEPARATSARTHTETSHVSQGEETNTAGGPFSP